MPETHWIAAGAADALAPGARKLVFVPGGESIIVYHLNSQFYALENSCPHAGAALSGSACVDHVISCPAHGLRFDVRNGQCLASAGLRVPSYGVVIEDGQLWLLPPEPPPSAA